jgi:hypothetical protein
MIQKLGKICHQKNGDFTLSHTDDHMCIDGTF